MGNSGRWDYLHDTPPVWTRDAQAYLVASLVNAVEARRVPTTDREADVYRLSAQLLTGRFRQAADFLDSAARQFYASANVHPRSFAQVLADGLVVDVSRLRNMLEQHMKGIRSW